ncbi:unnamed protein product, partial [Ectocarpus sp. 12 AP-2014]
EPDVSPEALVEVHRALSSAAHPVILMGGGGWREDGCRDMEQFALAADIPVVAAFRYQDRFDNTLRVYTGEAGVGMLPEVQKTLAEADLILAVGVRFGEMTTANHTLFDLPKMSQTLIHTHTSAQELGKIYQPDIAINAGPNAVANALATLEVIGGWGPWRQSARARYEASFDLP